MLVPPLLRLPWKIIKPAIQPACVGCARAPGPICSNCQSQLCLLDTRLYLPAIFPSLAPELQKIWAAVEYRGLAKKNHSPS